MIKPRPAGLHAGLLCAATAASVLMLAAFSPGGSRPAAATNFRYEITFTAGTAAARSLDVLTGFTVDAAGPVELSLPAWTPGAYEISNFARNVSRFTAAQGERTLDWDKTDPDTWRLDVPGPGPVEVRFRFTADSLDNAMAWTRPDFLLLNGTNVFLYPEGTDFEFSAAVVVHTEPSWQVATGMTAVGRGRYEASSYHELVDMPFFIGRLRIDSAKVDGAWHHLASYPADVFAGQGRQVLWKQLEAMVPPMTKVFADTPWTSYTTLLIFDSTYAGGSALEHANSHVGIYHPMFIGSPVLASITAHEIFHAWNVKRLRPAELVPYRYADRQPTTLLWVSEGITDYYADLALVRGGIIDSTVFLNVTAGKMAEVAEAPPVALEDASLSTWIHPTDGTHTLYYPKGSLAGLLLDILIRDASANRRSLDDVLRSLYQSEYQRQNDGFTSEEWWRAVTEAAGGRAFADFHRQYIDGRDPFPWSTVAPLAGLTYVADTIREPRLGVSTTGDGGPETVTEVTPGSSAAAAGILPGDALVSIGNLRVDRNFGAAFRAQFRRRIGETVPVVLRRGERELTVSLTIGSADRVEQRLDFDRRASLKAARIRHGILHGVTER